jgi:hypothetical protein
VYYVSNTAEELAMRFILISASLMMLGGCNMSADARQSDGGEGQGTERRFNLGGFDTVSLAGPHDVIVTTGPAHSVRAEGDPETLDRLKIEVEGSNLKIGAERGSWSFGWKNVGKTIIHVSMPAIRGTAIAGSGDMRVDRVQSDRFTASIAGSGDLQIGSLKARDAKFSIAGSGNIRASGSAERADISVAGSGDVDLGSLETKAAGVSIVGSGDVRARAMEVADVSIMGSGDVTLSGSARCMVNKRGSGNVRCGA